MNSDIFNFLLFGCIFILILGLVELTYRKFSLPEEFSRKIIHIVSGTTASFFIYIFEYQLTAVVMAFLFVLVVSFGKKYGFLRSIHNVRRESIGVLIFPVSICLIFLLTWNLKLPRYAYFVTVLILGISDPMASLGGYINLKMNGNTKWMISTRPFKTKTWPGSILFFITSLIIILVSFFRLTDYEPHFIVLASFVISFAATLAEMFSYKGWDNLTAPLAVWGSIFLIESGFF